MRFVGKSKIGLFSLKKARFTLKSLGLSSLLEKQILDEPKEINRIAWGPLGLVASAVEEADLVLPFSKMTFLTR